MILQARRDDVGCRIAGGAGQNDGAGVSQQLSHGFDDRDSFPRPGAEVTHRCQKPLVLGANGIYLRSEDNERRGSRREPHDRRHRPLLRRVRLNIRVIGHNCFPQCRLGFYVGQEWELEARNRGGSLDGLMFPARNDAIIFETNIEPFVQVESLESSPKTETDFVPLDGVDIPGVPLPSSVRSCGLNKDLVPNQDTGAFLGQARNRKASELVNYRLVLKDKNTD